MFNRKVLYDFIDKINAKQICSPIALGDNTFYGVSDSNLNIYIKRENKIWGITKRKLEHIGWEKYTKKYYDKNYNDLKKDNIIITRYNNILNYLDETIFIEV